MNDAPLLLFVCSGNICRSPMAAAIAADVAARAGMRIRVASSGTMALVGNPAEADAASKVVTFDELTGLGDIPDPYGAGLDDYRTVRDMLVAGMPRVLDALKATTAAKAKHRSAQ